MAATRSRLELATTVTLACCALAVTAVVVRREVRRPPDPAKPVEVNNWASYDVGPMRSGPVGAGVVIIEFGDYQCPYCRELHRNLASVVAAQPGRIRFVHRNFPIARIHPHARAAAVSAVCAARLGQFQEYHSLLYDVQDSIGHVPWTVFAARAGIADTLAFRVCLSDPTVRESLRSDSIAAAKLGARGTPTLLVNRWLLRSAPRKEILSRIVAAELTGISAR